MKVRICQYKEVCEVKDISLEEFVKCILDNDTSFLEEEDPNMMFEGFIDEIDEDDFPEGIEESKKHREEIINLLMKEKDAHDSEVYEEFVQECRDVFVDYDVEFTDCPYSSKLYHKGIVEALRRAADTLEKRYYLKD